MKQLELKIPPVGVGAVVAFAAWGASRWALLPVSWLAPWWVASTLGFGGALIAAAGVLSFMRARTTVNPHNPGGASSLVTSGVYRWTRNPMYLGMLLVLLGWGFKLGGLLPPLVVLLFIPYMTRFQIVPEERTMVTLFGEEFERYCQRVRRWM